MKFLFIVLVISGFTRAVGAEEVKITDFRIPPSSAFNINFKGGLGGFNGFGYYPFYTLGRYNRYRSLSVSGSGSLEINYRKENEANQLQLYLFPAIRSGYDSYNSVADTLPFYDERISGYLGLNSNIDLRHYVRSSIFNIWGSLNSSNDLAYIQQQSHKMKVFIRGQGEGFVGMGAGKIRDGFYVAQAIRFAEVLKDEKLIEAPLNKPVILDLAQLFSQKWEYQMKHWRWEKYFFADVEKFLTETGIIKGPLSAYSLLRLREIIAYSPFNERPFGFRFDCGIGGQTENIEELHPAVKFGENFGWPLSLRNHIYQELGLTVPFADTSTGLALYSNNSYQYEVIDRFNIRLSYDVNYQKNYSNGTYKFKYGIDQTFGASLVYYIENNLSLNISGGYKIDVHQGELPPYKSFNSHGFFSLNLTYRIL